MSRLWRASLLLIAFVLVLTGGVWAQSQATTGVIEGTVTGPEMRTGSDEGAAAKAASADRTSGEAERAASNDQRMWSLPCVAPDARESSTA